MNKQQMLEEAWSALEFQVALNRKLEKRVKDLEQELKLRDPVFTALANQQGDQ